MAFIQIDGDHFYNGVITLACFHNRIYLKNIPNLAAGDIINIMIDPSTKDLFVSKKDLTNKRDIGGGFKVIKCKSSHIVSVGSKAIFDTLGLNTEEHRPWNYTASVVKETINGIEGYVFHFNDAMKSQKKDATWATNNSEISPEIQDIMDNIDASETETTEATEKTPEAS